MFEEPCTENDVIGTSSSLEGVTVSTLNPEPRSPETLSPKTLKGALTGALVDPLMEPPIDQRRNP